MPDTVSTVEPSGAYVSCDQTLNRLGVEMQHIKFSGLEGQLLEDHRVALGFGVNQD